MRAVVLCAGRGTRLGALTERVPKPLLDVGGRPLLAYTLEWLAREGVAEVVVNLHHLGDLVPTLIGDGGDFGVSITYVREDRLLGTAGSVRNMAPLLGDDDVLVVYGDLLVDASLDPLVRTHRERAALATLLVHRRAGSNSRIELDDRGRIVAFEERPSLVDDREHWVNSGIAILSRALRTAIPDRVPCDLPLDVYVPNVASGELYGVPLTGDRIAVDSPARLEAARDAVANGRFRAQR